MIKLICEICLNQFKLNVNGTFVVKFCEMCISAINVRFCLQVLFSVIFCIVFMLMVFDDVCQDDKNKDKLQGSGTGDDKSPTDGSGKDKSGKEGTPEVPDKTVVAAPLSSDPLSSDPLSFDPLSSAVGDTDKDKDKGAPGLGGKAFPYEGDELVNGPVAVAMGTDKPSPKGQKENIKLEIPGVHTYIFC